MNPWWVRSTLCGAALRYPGPAQGEVHRGGDVGPADAPRDHHRTRVPISAFHSARDRVVRDLRAGDDFTVGEDLQGLERFGEHAGNWQLPRGDGCGPGAASSTRVGRESRPPWPRCPWSGAGFSGRMRECAAGAAPGIGSGAHFDARRYVTTLRLPRQGAGSARVIRRITAPAARAPGARPPSRSVLHAVLPTQRREVPRLRGKHFGHTRRGHGPIPEPCRGGCTGVARRGGRGAGASPCRCPRGW